MSASSYSLKELLRKHEISGKPQVTSAQARAQVEAGKRQFREWLRGEKNKGG